MFIVRHWQWIAWGCMALLWFVFVVSGGQVISHGLTLVFIACLALSLL